MSSTAASARTLDAPAKSPQLNFTRAAIVVGFGAVLWFVGIFQIRLIGATGALGNGLTPLVYAAILVATIPFVWAAPRAVGLPRAYRLHCGAIMAATAALLDGLAVRWTHWYAADPHLLANSAATLLWAIGVVVALALVMSLGGADGA